jgi:hypothetical protein
MHGKQHMAHSWSQPFPFDCSYYCFGCCCWLPHPKGQCMHVLGVGQPTTAAEAVVGTVKGEGLRPTVCHLHCPLCISLTVLHWLYFHITTLIT